MLAFSRVYLRVHYVLDVLVGLVLGTAFGFARRPARPAAVSACGRRCRASCRARLRRGLLCRRAALGACGDVQRRARDRPAPPQQPRRARLRPDRVYTREHPLRGPATTRERAAAAFIADRFADYGYEPRLEPVTGWTQRRHASYESANVVAVKRGESERRIIVGAHYDSRPPGEGATDNASGVAVLLELALRLRDRPTPYTIEFVAFGAEEAGWWGSRAYYDATVTGTRGEVVCMVNLDVSAGATSSTRTASRGSRRLAARPRAEARARARRAAAGAARPQPGPSRRHGRRLERPPLVPAGRYPPPVDRVDQLEDRREDGFTTTSKAGELWHTGNDTVAFVDATFPGRLERQLGEVIAVLERFLRRLRPAGRRRYLPAPAPSPAMPQP